VLAPVLPFITEHLYQDLVARHHPEAPVSIHHRNFPVADPALIDADLEASMETIREVVRLGRNLRKSQRVRVRQPLSRLTVLTGDDRVTRAIDTHAGIIAEELNVKEVVVSPDEGQLVTLSAKANFRRLGPILGRRMGEVAAAIAALSHDDVARLVAGETLEAAGQEIGLEDVIVERTPIEGTIVEAGPDFACALDSAITDELRLEGLAREIVSRVQNLRRQAGLEVTDRIRLHWHTEDPALAAALEAHQEHISSEVLATSVARSSEPRGEPAEVDHATVWLEIERA
jgi:isoleucyl-tRNA synthetase